MLFTQDMIPFFGAHIPDADVFGADVPKLVLLVCSPLPCCCLVANINGIETLLSHEPLLLSNCCHHPLLLCLTFSLCIFL